ncbi:hypothetical protein CspHIS471_0106710 [Cutaneotrichosporon sp. HIS471]|nr:hypothetical protein CspHIS471_0106710 [Cutaneotrichosporon sp. HIS471]
MLAEERNKMADRQHKQILKLLDDAEADLPNQLPVATRGLVGEWVRQYKNGTSEAETESLLIWERFVTADLAAMDTSDANVAHAVEVHMAIAAKVHSIAEEYIQSIRDKKWREELTCYRLSLEPAVAQLRRFITIWAPSLGKPSTKLFETLWVLGNAVRVEEPEARAAPVGANQHP